MGAATASDAAAPQVPKEMTLDETLGEVPLSSLETRPLSVVRCPLSVVRCPLSVVRCPLSVVRCLFLGPFLYCLSLLFHTHLSLHFEPMETHSCLPAFILFAVL